MIGTCSWECIKDMTPTSRIGGHLVAHSLNSPIRERAVFGRWSMVMT